MNVVIDIGNTRLKWACVTDGKLHSQGSALHAGAFDEAFENLAAALPPAAGRVLAANVAGDKFAERLSQLIRARYRTEPDYLAVRAEALGVRCGYANPARLGVDRWAAAIAGYQSVRGAVCVIGAGTAVTFDAVNAGGRHLGGLIFAGARLAAAELDKSTHAIGATPLAAGRPSGLALLGTNTDTAVGHAALLGVAAGLDRAVATVREALGDEPVVLMTGGDAERLAGWLETRATLRADLVLEGLALFLEREQ